MAFFGLKLGLDLEMPAAHPHQKFQGVPPGAVCHPNTLDGRLPPGGYSLEFLVGVCRPHLQIQIQFYFIYIYMYLENSPKPICTLIGLKPVYDNSSDRNTDRARAGDVIMMV